MLEASGVGLALRLVDIPVLPGALALAEKGTFSGGMKRNRMYLEETLGARGRLSLGPSVGAAHAGLLFESETSGGLLFAVAPEDTRLVHDGFERRGEPCWEIGEVTTEIGLSVR
jgi:selenide,water dikinase